MTYICAVAQINGERLKSKDCIITLNRSFDPSNKLNEVAYLNLVNQDPSGISERVNQLLGGDKFDLYMPHISLHESMICVTHENCQGYYYIEEGQLSVDYKLEKGDIKNTPVQEIVRKLKGRPTKLLVDPFLFKGLISITNEAFKGYPQTKRYTNAVAEIELETPSNKVDILFVLDGLPYVDGAVDIHIYYKFLLKVLNDIRVANPGKCIHIKDHPSSKVCLDDLGLGSHYSILNHTFCLEKIIHIYRPEVHLIFSSVEYYAKSIGLEVVSYSDELIKLDNNYFLFLEKAKENMYPIPKSFLEALENSEKEVNSVKIELETTKRELQTANEAVETTKRELQTANEAVETTKRELTTIMNELEAVSVEYENGIKVIESAINWQRSPLKRIFRRWRP